MMYKENFHKPFVVGLLSKDVSMYVWNNLLHCVLCCCCGIYVRLLIFLVIHLSN
ncbi:hypothetical protein ISN45_Aa01g022220 [Arabidopsis thaliana x Arabidopsis arenosa]|uniref:Uncharacterized protein n=3 Tax=Arabidopsis TaxID=3701 RepID=A0A8T1XSP6_ARASU|nr:hypothetical protein ISN44_As13g011940 [Arabidopsis suecica]KAG7593419.1 hypothetical protein ISN45_Aa01g022220 [Arabidopsis thaliana x Arabidopsis arenosa]KAG7537286.1 hypothetical protein ISN44_As13g011940 [Arabidopsis suecica]KAG7537287.1 hypothetical protein ISN44_As13g011940 [Arabidopsis suecica]KAG7566484.1 hypothetical protein ISN44_As10g030380 [Arabidopsis suecica]